MGKTHKKIVIAGVCCLMISMLTGCGNDTTKITEGMQLVETLDYQGALTVFEEAEAQKENSRLIAPVMWQSLEKNWAEGLPAV